MSSQTARPAGDAQAKLRRRRSTFVVSILVALPLAIMAGCTEDEPVAQSTTSAPRSTDSDPGGSESPSPGGGAGSPVVPESTTGSGSTGTGSTAPSGGCRYLDVSETGVYDLGDAGSVSLTWKGGQLTLNSTDPAVGWAARLDSDEDDVDEIEVEFTRGDRLVELEAEIEDDGRLELKVCERSRSRN